MSRPISYCLVAKAANGDEEAYKYFFESMVYNLAYGIFSTTGCSCDPQCHASEEKMEALDTRFKREHADLKEKRREEARNWYEDAELENGKYQCVCVQCKKTFIGHKRRVQCRTCAHSPGKFERIMMPVIKGYTTLPLPAFPDLRKIMQAQPMSPPTIRISRTATVLEAVVASGVFPSKSDARRVIQMGGVELNYTAKLKEAEKPLGANDGDTLKIGRKRYFRVELS